MPVITDLFRLANYAEAGFWLFAALVGAIIGFRRAGRVRSRCFILAGTLLLFGLSDVVETRTGAWWRPWWLFAWKSACVAVLLALFVEHYRPRWTAWRAARTRRDTPP